MYTGLTGKVMIGTQTIAYISNWSIDMSRDVIEVPQLGSPNKHKVAGLKDWSASADGTVLFGAPPTVPSGLSNHAILFNTMNSGLPVVCKFYLNETTYFSGNGLIESLSVDLSAEDKGNISISISGVGPLSTPVPAASNEE